MVEIIIGYIVFIFIVIRVIKKLKGASNYTDKKQGLKILDYDKLKPENLLNSNKMFETDSKFEDMFGNNNNPIKEKDMRRKDI